MKPLLDLDAGAARRLSAAVQRERPVGATACDVLRWCAGRWPRAAALRLHRRVARGGSSR